MKPPSDEEVRYQQWLQSGKRCLHYLLSEDFDKALETTQKMLEMADKYSDWNSDNARHAAWSVRGLVAIESNDIEKAVKCLIQSAEIDGSPQQKSFGPSMILAKRLLAVGQAESVQRYLKRISGFWDKQMCDYWISDIKTGRQVDFGPNICYGF